MVDVSIFKERSSGFLVGYFFIYLWGYLTLDRRRHYWLVNVTFGAQVARNGNSNNSWGLIYVVL